MRSHAVILFTDFDFEGGFGEEGSRTSCIRYEYPILKKEGINLRRREKLDA
jgi:hypothetical protein